MILQIILDGSASMNGMGKHIVQQNSARLIRRYAQHIELCFWSLQQELTNISPTSDKEDILFQKNHGKVNEQVLIDFLNQLPEQSSILFLTDGFVLNKDNMRILANKNHRAYWIMIGPDARANERYLSQTSLQIATPETLIQTLQLIDSQQETRPLAIDPIWMQATHNDNDNDKDEW